MNLLRPAAVLMCLPALAGCHTTDRLVGACLVIAVKQMIGAPVISFEYSEGSSPRSISLTIDCNRKLVLTTHTEKKEPVKTERTLTESEYSQLLDAIRSVNWDKVSQDTVRGCDGSELRITRDGKEIPLWSPDYNTRKRGLQKVSKLTETAFHLAGLDARGLPPPQNH